MMRSSITGWKSRHFSGPAQSILVTKFYLVFDSLLWPFFLWWVFPILMRRVKFSTLERQSVSQRLSLCLVKSLSSEVCLPSCCVGFGLSWISCRVYISDSLSLVVGSSAQFHLASFFCLNVICCVWCVWFLDLPSKAVQFGLMFLALGWFGAFT